MTVFHKLRGRSARELRERAAHAARVALERAGLSGDRGVPSDAAALSELCDAAGRPFASADAAHSALIAPSMHRLVPGLADLAGTVAAVDALDPRACVRGLAAAERFASGRFDLLGYEDLAWGSPIDWHLDPVSGRHAPGGHWSRIQFLDHAVAGDHKVIWEINRHQWLVTLAQTWQRTRDERWAELALGHMDDWIAANPAKDGINWASSLEVAFRSLSWIWTLQLLHDSRALTPRRHVRALAVLAQGGRHIERNLSTWFSPNTHLTGEALALFAIGCGVPALRDATRLRDCGERILDEWMPRHVRGDGTYVEQSTWYARYTADFLVHAIVIGEHAGRSCAAARAALDRLATVLLAVLRPDGSYPLIADDDGGRLLFLDHRPATDLRSTLANAAALLGRDDLAWGAGPARDEPAWLLGARGRNALETRRPAVPARHSFGFPEGGLFVMRDGWSDTASMAVIDCGPHGFLNGGHSHADLLSVDLALHGRPVVRDPGTYSYTVSAESRREFRAAESHGTVTVDGVGAATSAGPFRWASCPSRVSARWGTSAAADGLLGSHDGFASLPGAPAHRRAVLRAGTDYWMILDELAASGAHTLSVHLPLAAGLTVAGDAIRDGEAVVARLQHAGTEAVWQPRAGWQSRAYGQRAASTTLTLESRASGRQAIATVIAGGDVALPILTQSGAEAFEVRSCDGWTDLLVLPDRGTAIVGEIEISAALAWIRRDTATGQWIAALLLDATRLVRGGITWFASTQPVERLAVGTGESLANSGWTAEARAALAPRMMTTPS